MGQGLDHLCGAEARGKPRGDKLELVVLRGAAFIFLCCLPSGRRACSLASSRTTIQPDWGPLLEVHHVNRLSGLEPAQEFCPLTGGNKGNQRLHHLLLQLPSLVVKMIVSGSNGSKPLVPVSALHLEVSFAVGRARAARRCFLRSPLLRGADRGRRARANFVKFRQKLTRSPRGTTAACHLIKFDRTPRRQEHRVGGRVLGRGKVSHDAVHL
mmetsp:Transcript_16608/g.41076  ORF Transcript_16608/g.41076 Transcript_16608/m.41076 type:complete len:212 (-) Transcript_16608:2918-3553(-)